MIWKLQQGTVILSTNPAVYNNLGDGEYVGYGLGPDAMDGQWHTFVRDLQADLEEAQPGVTILEVNRFLIRGSGMLDDIALINDVPSYTTTYEDAEDGSTDRWYVYDNTPVKGHRSITSMTVTVRVVLCNFQVPVPITVTV